jgi:hypothetical protein
MKDTFTKFEDFMQNKTTHELGALLAEYIAESNHNGWEGFDRRSLTGVRNFLDDVMMYHHGVVENDKEHFGAEWHYSTGVRYIVKQ